MGKIILTTEKLDQLELIIEQTLDALSQAHLDKEEVRKQISKIIVNRFKKHLGII